MALSPAARAGRVLYGATFALALPGVLALWARATEGAVTLPALRSPAGLLLLAAGVALILWGWAALWLHGGGLPMNAFPPQRLVTRGPYALFAHPIYVGFCAAVLGAAIWRGSASGLWLVFPCTALACAALVLGYEGRDLRERFGAAPRPLFALPDDSPERATAADRLRVLLLVMVPWLAFYGAAILATPERGISTFLRFEARWPVVEEAELVYASTYPVVFAAALAPRTKAEARDLIARGLYACALVFPLYFALPLVASPRPFEPRGVLGDLLLFERAHDTPAAAFPSFHVLFALMAAEAWAGRWPRLAWPARIWAGLAVASCLLTGMHSLFDVAAGAAAFALVMRAERVWDALRRLAERAANSWREWRLGPVRIINHGAWAGLGNLIALSIVAAALGPGHSGTVVATASAGLVGSLLWARLIERPPPMMRPYGFYGGVFGIMIAAAFFPEPWTILAGYCCAAPFVQSLGRVRCLVQGCCHGARASEGVGIRYRIETSRVVKCGLGGVPLHPTPLYSILWNAVIALVLLRLWWAHAPAHFVGGLYLVLSALGRFVEESFRGEPQTPTLWRLRVYQWVAAATVLGGIAIMSLARGAPMAAPGLDWRSVAAAAAYGLLTWAALGVDFPESNRRFSRLA